MTEPTTPLVSIIIPCYNQAHFLPEAIESAYRRLTPDVKWSWSTMVRPTIRRRWWRVTPDSSVCDRITGVWRKRAMPVSARALGEYVLFLDADDRLTPNAVEAHLSCFAKHPEAGFVVGDIDHITLDGSYVGFTSLACARSQIITRSYSVNHVANTIAVMFRRSVMEQLGGFKPACSPAEDYDYCCGRHDCSRADIIGPSSHNIDVTLPAFPARAH